MAVALTELSMASQLLQQAGKTHGFSKGKYGKNGGLIWFNMVV